MQSLVLEGKDGRLQEWTVGQLVEQLLKLPLDTLVVCSSDAEGNRMHPLMSIDMGARYRKQGFAGDIVEAGFLPGDRPCIVLVPMD